MNKKQEIKQRQHQNINIANDVHGMTDDVVCAFVDYNIKGMPTYKSTWAQNQVTVKILIYKGEVKKIFCHHYSNGRCTSEYNNYEEKKCYLSLMADMVNNDV